MSDARGGLVVNEQGNDADTRIEGDTDPNLVFADASTGRVGIGTGTPAQKLDVSGMIAGKGFIPAVTVVTPDENGDLTFSANTGGVFSMVVNANRTIIAQGGTDGQKILLRIIQDGNGRTVTFGSTFQFGSDIPSANLSTTDDKVDYVTCIFQSSNSKWHVVNVVRGFSV